MSSGISRDEWLQALTSVGLYSEEDDPKALTVTEFAALFNVPPTTAQSQLRRLAEKGKAIATKKWTTDTRGHRKQRTAYRLVDRKRR